MVDSIHGNPARRGLVARPEDWQWSIARWYAGIRPVRIEISQHAPRKHQWKVTVMADKMTLDRIDELLRAVFRELKARESKPGRS
jgi:hypothetical protein